MVGKTFLMIEEVVLDDTPRHTSTYDYLFDIPPKGMSNIPSHPDVVCRTYLDIPRHTSTYLFLLGWNRASYLDIPFLGPIESGRRGVRAN